MVNALSPVDPAHCPLCGHANRCAMEQEKQSGLPQPPCWCTRADFSPALIATVPEPARDKACICAACAAAGAQIRARRARASAP